jgi:hypothetical protein
LSHLATEAVPHPDWTEDTIPNDLGLVALAEDAPTAPIRLIGSPEKAEDGEQVRLVGFGNTAFGGVDNGTKRAGTATIDDEDASTMYLAPSPSLTCNGDSGGPLFVEREGAWAMAGIHSRSDCETQSFNERVDVHRDGRIADFIAAHGGGGVCMGDGTCDDGCSYDPDCVDGAGTVVGGCAASGGAGGGAAAAAFALGLAAVVTSARRRRRRR